MVFRVKHYKSETYDVYGILDENDDCLGLIEVKCDAESICDKLNELESKIPK